MKFTVFLQHHNLFIPDHYPSPRLESDRYSAQSRKIRAPRVGTSGRSFDSDEKALLVFSIALPSVFHGQSAVHAAFHYPFLFPRRFSQSTRFHRRQDFVGDGLCPLRRHSRLLFEHLFRACDHSFGDQNSLFLKWLPATYSTSWGGLPRLAERTRRSWLSSYSCSRLWYSRSVTIIVSMTRAFTTRNILNFTKPSLPTKISNK